MGFRSAVSSEDIPTISYYNQAPHYSFNYDGVLDTKYFKNCKDDKNGGLVAIVPDPSKNDLAYDINEALSNIFFYEENFSFFL